MNEPLAPSMSMKGEELLHLRRRRPEGFDYDDIGSETNALSVDVISVMYLDNLRVNSSGGKSLDYEARGVPEARRAPAVAREVVIEIPLEDKLYAHGLKSTKLTGTGKSEEKN